MLAGSASARVNIPDWVAQAAAAKVGNLPAEVKAVWLLDQTDYTVTAPGQYSEHSRTVLKVLRPEGREYGNPAVWFRKNEKVRLLHAWSIDAAGNEYEVKDKDFLEKGVFDFELYSDHMERSAHAPALQPGTIVAFENEIDRHVWINELGWRYQSELPVVESVLSMELPVGWEYRTAWSSGSATAPTKTGPNRWQWRLENLPGIDSDLEPMMPPFRALAGRMSIAYFAPGENVATSASWRQVGHWYSGLVGGRASAGREIASKVQSLTADRLDFNSRLTTLTRFVQSEVRYVAISIGIGGDQPHLADDVFRYRYGDCKDKVALLKAMLEVAGIHSYYVLIDTRRGFINPSVPSSWGNHAIIAIEIPAEAQGGDYQSVITAKSGKRYLIFDPTDEYTPVGYLSSDLQSSYALMVLDDGGELIRTPLLPPEFNVISRMGHFALSSEGGLSGQVAEEHSGDFARFKRAMLHRTDQRQFDHLLSEWLGRSIQGFSLEKIDIEHTSDLQKNLLIRYQIGTPLYGQSRGPLMLVRPRVLADMSQGVAHKPRHYPLELQQTGREVDRFEIELPENYAVDDLPNPVHLDVGFASYESKIEVEGRTLKYWRQYSVRELAVPLEKYADWVRLQGAIGADEAAVAVLKRTP
jgi:hypothetical protein